MHEGPCPRSVLLAPGAFFAVGGLGRAPQSSLFAGLHRRDGVDRVLKRTEHPAAWMVADGPGVGGDDETPPTGCECSAKLDQTAASLLTCIVEEQQYIGVGGLSSMMLRFARDIDFHWRRRDFDLRRRL